MSDIFISYKREDQLPARLLADVLERQGWSVWWDPKLHAGERFDDVIEKALVAARCVVVVWSRRSIVSTYVRDEATYALNRDKLVPLKIEEVELPFRFEGIHTPELVDWDGKEMAPAFRSILRDIIVILGPSPRMEEERKAEEEAERLLVEGEKKKRAERERQKELTLELERKAAEEKKRKAEKVRMAQDVAKPGNASATPEPREPTVPTKIFSSQKKWLAIVVLVFGILYVSRDFWLLSAGEHYEVNTAPSNPSSSRSVLSEKQPFHLSRAQNLALSQTQWKSVQRSLNDIGLDAGPIDGVPGSRTRQAITLFQNSRGFPATGMITEAQLARLFSDAGAADKGQLGGEKPRRTPSLPFDPEQDASTQRAGKVRSESRVSSHNVSTRRGTVVWTADVSRWPIQNYGYGRTAVSPAGYEIQANSNTIVGSGLMEDMVPLNGDFRWDLSFRLLTPSAQSLILNFAGTGERTRGLDVFLGNFGAAPGVNYSISEYRVEQFNHWHQDREVARHVTVPLQLQADLDWTANAKLSLIRSGSKIGIYLNDSLITEFDATFFVVHRCGVGFSNYQNANQPAKVLLTGIKAMRL